MDTRSRYKMDARNHAAPWLWIWRISAPCFSHGHITEQQKKKLYFKMREHNPNTINVSAGIEGLEKQKHQFEVHFFNLKDFSHLWYFLTNWEQLYLQARFCYEFYEHAFSGNALDFTDRTVYSKVSMEQMSLARLMDS